jgi:four helix bundle protein
MRNYELRIREYGIWNEECEPKTFPKKSLFSFPFLILLSIYRSMKSDNIIQQKSFAFSKCIVNLCKYIIKEQGEYIMSKQLLRSGTSIGANVEEAVGAQSRKDFYAKITIAYKEARETKYWIRLMKETDYLSYSQCESLLAQIEEILKILGSIQKTINNKSQNC